MPRDAGALQDGSGGGPSPGIRTPAGSRPVWGPMVAPRLGGQGHHRAGSEGRAGAQRSPGDPSSLSGTVEEPSGVRGQPDDGEAVAPEAPPCIPSAVVHSAIIPRAASLQREVPGAGCCGRRCRGSPSSPAEKACTPTCRKQATTLKATRSSCKRGQGRGTEERGSRDGSPWTALLSRCRLRMGDGDPTRTEPLRAGARGVG